LQGTLRRISPETLQAINRLLMSHWVEQGELSLEWLRIDSVERRGSGLSKYQRAVIGGRLAVIFVPIFQMWTPPGEGPSRSWLGQMVLWQT
jgi:hypothetical protein